MLPYQGQMSTGRIITRTLAVLACLAAHAGAAGPWADSVLLEDHPGNAMIRLEAKNRSNLPMTVVVDVRGAWNARPDVEGPLVWVLTPGNTAPLFTLERVEAASHWTPAYDWRFCPGDATVVHDDAFRYLWPFDPARPRMLIAGLDDGSWHSGRLRHGFDFEMPPGTPVLAARDGIVVRTRDDYSIGGGEPWLLDKANFVTVLHEDGTFATYAHLRQGGVDVEEGQRVEAGEGIGSSGRTGFAVEPHLHFAVWRAGGDGRTWSVPIRFEDGSPEGLVPEAGMVVPQASNRAGPGDDESFDSQLR
jgi:murein DD-endopeptidase MepM/ murein hydrolase activator NlpD